MKTWLNTTVLLAIHDKDVKPSKATLKECQEFLEILGINTDNVEALTKELQKAECRPWDSLIPPSQVVKHGELPVITIYLPEDELNRSFEWTLQEENGKFHHGEFYSSHLQILNSYTIQDETCFRTNLALPILLDIGYHTLTIKSESGKADAMKLIIVPRKCYQPLSVDKKEHITGLKFNLYIRL